MRKVLIASGDSWTDPDYIAHSHPDMDCSWLKWPEILAEKLDMDCINLGSSGAGNKYIFNSLVDQIQLMEPDDIGYVMAGWSQAPRVDVKVRDMWRSVDPYPMDPAYSTQIIDRRGDVTHWVQESILRFYSLQEICKSKNIPLLQVQMIPLYGGYNWNLIKQSRDNADSTTDATLLQTINDSIYIDKIEDNFVGWPTESDLGGINIQMDVIDEHIISELDIHPNEKGQIQIAEYLYDKI
jgi:hypothetical protein